MRIPLSDISLAWVQLPGLALHLATGTILGSLHFRSLSWSVSWLAGDGRVPSAIAFMILRFIVLGGSLTLASLAGALHLLVVTLGVFIGRSVVMRRIREATP